MTWLEDRFRWRFEPHGDGFLFQQVDREVIFDREEVEQLVADWRRYWLSPLLWGAFLLIGVALPAVYWLWGIQTGSVTVLIVSGLTIVGVLVTLWVAQRGPDEAAFMHKSVGPGRGRNGYGGDIFTVVMALVWLGILRADGFWGNWPFWLWGAALAISLMRIIRRLWRQRRGPMRPA